MDTVTGNCGYCGSVVTRKRQSVSANVRMHFCSGICKALYQKLAKPVTRDWLEDQYIGKHLACAQIAKLVQRDPKSVWYWLKDFGIPTRPRGGHNRILLRSPVCSALRRSQPSKIPPIEVLRDLYLIQGKNTRQIAELLGAGQTSVLRWLKKAGIGIRTARECCLRDGRVPYLKNGVHFLKLLTRDQHPSWKGGITPERQQFYAGDEWRASSRKVWARDRKTCQRCGLEFEAVISGTIRFEIHHIDSFQIVERRATLDNLILLCERCHTWIHSKSNTEGVLLGKGHRFPHHRQIRSL